MTNCIKDPVEAIRIYRLKDLIEKFFQSLLDELDVIEYYQQPGKAH